MVHQSEARMLTHYIVEISQNLYFVGLVLTYILWAALLKLRESRVRVIQIVLSLGVYFSINAANYALHNAYPNLKVIWEYLPPMAGMLLPVAWFYAFLRFDEEARLAPGASCGGAAMMAALILAISIMAMMQFFVSYCRSLIAASARRTLSPDVQDVIGKCRRPGRRIISG